MSARFAASLNGTAQLLAPPCYCRHVEQGRHLRFDDKGKAAESPQRTVLRGLPVASGKYKRFE